MHTQTYVDLFVSSAGKPRYLEQLVQTMVCSVLTMSLINNTYWYSDNRMVYQSLAFHLVDVGREMHHKAKLNSKYNKLLISICSSESCLCFGMSV